MKHDNCQWQWQETRVNPGTPTIICRLLADFHKYNLANHQAYQITLVRGSWVIVLQCHSNRSATYSP